MPTGMTSDADTFALWKFSASSGNELDVSPNGRDLVLVGTCPQVAGLVGNARMIQNNGATKGKFTLATSAPLVALLASGGDTRWCIEALVKVNGAAGGGPIAVISVPSSNVYGVFLRAFKDYIGLGGAAGLPGFGENVGVSDAYAGAMPADAWHYIAVSCSDIPAGSAPNGFDGPIVAGNQYFYVDGVLRGITTIGGIATGAAANSNLVVGDYYISPNTFANLGLGMDFNELRLSTRGRSPLEIAAQAVAYGLLGAPAADTTRPVIANVTPAAASLLARGAEGTAVGFDVTDTSGNLSRTSVLAYYPGVAAFEVVWHDSTLGGLRTAGFGPQYTGTRSVIANGFRFSNVIRRGGWPAAPTLVPDPFDLAGNESV